MLTTFKGLAIGLQALAQSVKEAVDRALTDRMALALKVGCQAGRALARPAQWSHRIATRDRINQRLEGLQESRVMLHQRLSAGALTA
jgi:hypothetical protein